MSELLGLLAGPERLRVVAALVLGARSTADVVTATELSEAACVKALNRLRRGGLVQLREHAWVLRADAFKEAARAAAPPPDTDDHGAPDERSAAVLRAFLRDGRLERIPAVRSKRLVVLDHVARVFDIGARYPEREVDAALRAFHPDHAALRRHLVDEGFLERADGVYWRAGGSVVL